MSNKSKILVIAQFSCFAYFIFNKGILAQNNWVFIQIFGFLISLSGILTMKINNFNIQPEVKLNAVFISTGIYKYLRNPMYTGIILIFIVTIINSFSIISMLVYLLLIYILLEKIKLEEIFLSNRFGKTYTDYKAKTSKLIPFLY